MRLLTFLAGVAAGVLWQQSRTAKQATSMSVPYDAPEIDDMDTVRPGIGLDVGTGYVAPVVAGVGVGDDGLRS